MGMQLAQSRHDGLVALVFGATVALVVRYLGPLSGAHINPAVTLALAAGGRLPRGLAAKYLIAQACGATSAALLLRVLLGDVADLGATAPSVGSEAAVLIEWALTLLLVLVVLALVVRPGLNKFAAVALGGTVGLEAYVAGGLTGASMNPARSLGPALVSGQLGDLWIYLVGPVLGALTALALVRSLLHWLPRLRQPPAQLIAPQSSPAFYSRGSSSVR
jgi:MIP family channel proteins